MRPRTSRVSWYSGGGWFFSAHTTGTGHRNVELRNRAVTRASPLRPGPFCLAPFARGLVVSKLRQTARTLLRRNWRGEEPPDALLASLQRALARRRWREANRPAQAARRRRQLARRIYFFGRLRRGTLRSEPGRRSAASSSRTANRRARRQTPVNAMAVLRLCAPGAAEPQRHPVGRLVSTRIAAFYHQPRLRAAGAWAAST